MKRLLRVLYMASILAVSPVFAQTFYVSTTGSDSNNCLSSGAACATWQHAFDLCPSTTNASRVCTVNIADGTYTEAQPSVNYYRVVQVNGNCNATQNVVLNGVLWGQDHAIVTANCLQAQAINTRQYTIMDAYFVHLTGSGSQIVAQEMSKINCLSAIYSNASAQIFMAASGMSQILGSCTQSTPGSNFSTAYSYATQLSMIDQSAASFIGTNTGPKCLRSDSSLIPGGASAPGTGSC